MNRRDAVPRTPDGRYIVVEGRAGPRLWRAADPSLAEEMRRELTQRLMNARRAIRDARGDQEAIARARAEVNDAKIKLGERGPVWWTDGSPDFNRRLVKNTPYAAWWRSQTETEVGGRP
jgi:hypothetical protein